MSVCCSTVFCASILPLVFRYWPLPTIQNSCTSTPSAFRKGSCLYSSHLLLSIKIISYSHLFLYQIVVPFAFLSAHPKPSGSSRLISQVASFKEPCLPILVIISHSCLKLLDHLGLYCLVFVQSEYLQLFNEMDSSCRGGRDNATFFSCSSHSIKQYLTCIIK